MSLNPVSMLVDTSSPVSVPFHETQNPTRNHKYENHIPKG